MAKASISIHLIYVCLHSLARRQRRALIVVWIVCLFNDVHTFTTIPYLLGMELVRNWYGIGTVLVQYWYGGVV